MTLPAPERADPPIPFRETPWLSALLPKVAEAVPTMLTGEEGQLLFWLTNAYATGVGAICDLGCFAGGSTARLVAGAMAAGWNTPIHAFDHFTLSEAQKERYLYPAGVDPFNGDNMLPAVQRLLAPWQGLVRFHPGDLTLADWTDGPIEVLFVDAAKTPASADRIAQIFFPHLIPGRSVIVQQDYLHWRQPWVAAQMERLHGALVPVAWCRKGTVAFRVEMPLTPGIIHAGQVATLSDDDLTDLLQRALYRFPERSQRADLARAIVGLQDNPGVRRPPQMNASRLTHERINDAIRVAEARFSAI